MRDPYEVLGISPGASSQQIRAAYTELAKKYHPDKYQNNPLGDLAAEKMKEINEAYDFLTKKGGQAAPGTGGYANYSASSTGKNPRYNDIRMAINRGDTDFAKVRLDEMSDRDAEWNFLYGVMSIRKGWYFDGVNYLEKAVAMDPTNPEYSGLLQQVRGGAAGYRDNSYARGYGDAQSQLCQCMSCYCCADACCDVC
jgi:curved DNA-binding protein CbpA